MSFATVTALRPGFGLGARDGSGEGTGSPADKVVDEIKALGGDAVANYDSVAGAAGGGGLRVTA